MRAVASADVVGVWQEAKSFQPLRYARGPEEEVVIADHFAARDTAETAFFSEHAHPRPARGAVYRRIAAGAINDETEVTRMEACRPDVVAVFGTGLDRIYPEGNSALAEQIVANGAIIIC